ncbi:MAG: hypothetical protein J6Y07_02865 [Alphaproteobacteria bacterium]|nr:hypothetical protein [Alphaproteobacteria bacterium]
MNNQKLTIVQDMGKKSQDTKLKENWDNLIQRFSILQYQISPTKYGDILKEVIDILKALKTNQPKPKIYRAKEKRLHELEQLFMQQSNKLSR